MLVEYHCEKCSKTLVKYYSKSKDAKDEIKCCDGGCLERQLSSPTTKTTQVIDSGIMQKKIEITNDLLEKEVGILKKRGEL